MRGDMTAVEQAQRRQDEASGAYRAEPLGLFGELRQGRPQGRIGHRRQEGLALGTGNGAVFQLVPQRFRKEIGVMTGLVGMAGGVGGFYLASSLGYSKQLTGSYQAGFLIFAALAVLALIGLTGVKTRWRTTWGASHLTAAKI